VETGNLPLYIFKTLLHFNIILLFIMFLVCSSYIFDMAIIDDKYICICS